MSQYIALNLLARNSVQEGYNGNLPHQVIINKIKLKINICKALHNTWDEIESCLRVKQDSNTEVLLVCTSWCSCLNSSVEVSRSYFILI